MRPPLPGRCAAPGTWFRVVCLGLSYKADIDDLRESPAVAVCQALASMDGIALDIVEPHTAHLPPGLGDMGDVSLSDLDTALSRADVVVVLTDHSAFRTIDPESLGTAFVVDARGLFRQSHFG